MSDLNPHVRNQRDPFLMTLCVEAGLAMDAARAGVGRDRPEKPGTS